jgi:hypothetical protein
MPTAPALLRLDELTYLLRVLLGNHNLIRINPPNEVIVDGLEVDDPIILRGRQHILDSEDDPRECLDSFLAQQDNRSRPRPSPLKRYRERLRSQWRGGTKRPVVVTRLVSAIGIPTTRSQYLVIVAQRIDRTNATTS